MTNYNDGKWHGWNGGECPVHPETVIDCSFLDGSHIGYASSRFVWDSIDRPILAFRVTKAYVEPPKPRDFWACRLRDEFKFDMLDHDPKVGYAEIIHVREVIK